MTQITQTRILWVILVFCVLTPMVFPLGLPLGPSPEGDAAYDFIHGLPAGSIAMMVIEVAPSSAGELWPMALAIGRDVYKRQYLESRCFRRLDVFPSGYCCLYYRALGYGYSVRREDVASSQEV